MASGGKRTGRKKEKISRYYATRHANNMQRKKERHRARIERFKARNVHFAVIIPQAIKQFLSPSVVSWYNSNIDKNNYAGIINDLADRLNAELDRPLPRGRVKQALRVVLSKP